MKRFLFIVAFLFFLSTDGLAAKEQMVVGTQNVYTYDILQKDLRQLSVKYPSELDVRVIGKSHFNRKIYAAELGRGEKNIILIGSHHGREWLTSSLLMKMLEEYTEAYSEGKKYGELATDILDEISIWFVPMLNPDGVTIQQGLLDKFPKYYQLRLLMMNEFRDDFSSWKANAKGVDLNRQYPAGWEELNKKPRFPSHKFYKGRRPLEAKEVKAIVDFTKEKSPLIGVAYHSSGREIFWKYKNGKHIKRDEGIAKKVSLLTGYRLSTPSRNATGGGYTDWFITTFHRPGMTIEICPPVFETNPPLSTFHEEWERNKFVGLMLVQESKDLLIKSHKNGKEEKNK